MKTEDKLLIRLEKGNPIKCFLTESKLVSEADKFTVIQYNGKSNYEKLLYEYSDTRLYENDGNFFIDTGLPMKTDENGVQRRAYNGKLFFYDEIASPFESMNKENIKFNPDKFLYSDKYGKQETEYVNFNNKVFERIEINTGDVFVKNEFTGEAFVYTKDEFKKLGFVSVESKIVDLSINKADLVFEGNKEDWAYTINSVCHDSDNIATLNLAVDWMNKIDNSKNITKVAKSFVSCERNQNSVITKTMKDLIFDYSKLGPQFVEAVQRAEFKRDVPKFERNQLSDMECENLYNEYVKDNNGYTKEELNEKTYKNFELAVNEEQEKTMERIEKAENILNDDDSWEQ